MTDNALRCLSAAQAAAICLAILVAISTAKVQAQREPAPPATLADSLKRFLQTLGHNRTTRYVAAFRDLNGDGIPEAIVYLVGPEWCGSGGCNMLILTQDRSSWRIVTKVTITQPPIRVLRSASNGWRSIGVWVQGGGIRRGYEAEPRFNGHTYPRNPTIPPSRRLGGKVAGEVVITSAQQAVPLYDD
jgi:hypothetical protein